MTNTTETFHQSRRTLPKCDTCGETATHGAFDVKEVTSSDGVYREFEATTEKRGCSQHAVVSYTTYLDGRVKKTGECVPEKVPCPAEQTL
jgi:hypothetical protein